MPGLPFLFMIGELKKCLTGGFVTGKYNHGAAQLNRHPPHFYSGVYSVLYDNLYLYERRDFE